MGKMKVDRIIRETDFEHNFSDYFQKNKEVTEYLRKKNRITLKENPSNFLRFTRFGNLDLPIELGQDYYISSVFDYVIALFMIELYYLGFKYTSIQDSKNSLLKNDRSKNLLEYYMVESVMGQEINIYVFDDSVEVMSINEFIMNRKSGIFSSAYVTISLNDIILKIKGSDKCFIGETYFPGLDEIMEKRVLAMMEDENLKCVFDEILNDKEYSSIILDKDGDKLDLIRKIKTYPLDAKLSDLKRIFPASVIKMDNFGGKTERIIVEEKLKIDEVMEKKKQLKIEEKRLSSE